jgi:DNA-binding transcriptional ArsR family regulator
VHVTASLQIHDLPSALLARILQLLSQHNRLSSCATVCKSWAAAAAAATTVVSIRRAVPVRFRTFQPWLQQHGSQLVTLSVRSVTRDLQLQLPCDELQQLESLDLWEIALSAPTAAAMLPSLRRLKHNCWINDSLAEQLSQLSSLTRLKIVQQGLQYKRLVLGSMTELLQRLTGLEKLTLSHAGICPCMTDNLPAVPPNCLTYIRWDGCWRHPEFTHYAQWSAGNSWSVPGIDPLKNRLE